RPDPASFRGVEQAAAWTWPSALFSIGGAAYHYAYRREIVPTRNARTRNTMRKMTTSELITFRHVLEAAAFAARAHQHHFRKDDKTPYVSHVFRVCLIVRDLFGFNDPRMLCTALLHD